jgi:hypothetical protein
MGDLIKIEEYLKKKKEESSLKNKVFTPILSVTEKIKKALEKYGSHRKNPNNDQ